MLYECHGHIILDGISYKNSVTRHKTAVDEASIRRNLKSCADCGVGFYRDGGDKYMVSAAAKIIAPEYGIDYRTPVFIIHKKGFYGGMFGRGFYDMTEYRALVTEAKQLGADFIKITVSGMLDFSNGGDVTGPALTLEELREIVKTAAGEGFAVMAHVNGANNIKNALEAGVSSVEHGFGMDYDAISILAQTDTVWVPTFAAVSNLIGSGRYDDNVLTNLLNSHRGSVKEAADRGVLIASGSDAGASCVFQGMGTLGEYGLLHAAGADFDAGNRKIAEIFGG